MMTKIRYIFIILMVMVPTGLLASEDSPEREFAYDSQSLAILKGFEKESNNKQTDYSASGLIILLSELSTEKSRMLLVELLDVYVGSANAEALDFAIVKQGEAIMPLLQKINEKAVECKLLKERKFCLSCVTLDNRNKRLKSLIDMIQNNVKLDYVI